MKIKLALAIRKSLIEDPNEWRFTKYQAKHNKYEIWIANGASFCRIQYPFDLGFGLISSYIVFYSIKKAKRIRAINYFGSNNHKH